LGVLIGGEKFLYLQQPFRHLQSSCSRKSRPASPARLNSTTDTNSARLGNRIHQGAVCRYARPLLIISPHSAEGASTPSPRKDRPARLRITLPMSDTAVTSMEETILG